MDGMRALSVPPERWEQGSDFHLALEVGSSRHPWSKSPHTLWGSGRDALRALVEWGCSTHGWRRILVPSYYCHDVTAKIHDQLEVAIYRHAPMTPNSSPVEATEGDVVLVVALFGMAPAPGVVGNGVVVEDHTHDPLAPWAIRSRAHYAFASLRKTLPLPDGGVLWSPRGLDGPSERGLTLDHDRGTLKRLAAMTLKRHYLSGREVPKAEVRTLAIDGERGIDRGEISAASSFTRSRLPSLPAARWREVRATNLHIFRAALGAVPAVTLLDAPFAATLLFDRSEDRDRVRSALIAARIYAAVLWPLDEEHVPGIPPEHVEISRRILSIHCDYRYDRTDMIRIASEIRAAGIPS